MEIFEFLWMEGWERTESPHPKMDTSKNGLFQWVDDLPKFWGLTVIWLKYIPSNIDSKSKLSEWEHNLWPWFLDIQSWKMLCNADSSHIYGLKFYFTAIWASEWTLFILTLDTLYIFFQSVEIFDYDSLKYIQQQQI